VGKAVAALGFLAAWLVLGTGLAAAANDPIFPTIGDRSYDVDHYDVQLSYEPAGNALRGVATIEATAAQTLSGFSLDLEGMNVTAVLVDGKPTTFSRRQRPAHGKAPREGKLVVAAPAPVPAGARFTARVEYQGTPRSLISGFLQQGWLATSDGAIGISTGLGTAAWLPCNNIPSDKATYTVQVTVPQSLIAVSNGRLTEETKAGGKATFTWVESQPMSTYLAVVDIGKGKLEATSINGIPSWNFIDYRLAKGVKRQLARVPEIIRFESRIFGPFPFDSAGSIVDYEKSPFAEETQSRPVYLSLETEGGGVRIRSPLPLVHEIAHQWFGDSVGPATWRETWLNEGFARWTEWYYAELHGGPSAAEQFRRLRQFPARILPLPAARPRTPGQIYSLSVYQRGAMALQALRMTVGTKTMLTILRQWAADQAYGSGTTGEFIQLAEQVSKRSLDALFRPYLFKLGPPKAPLPRDLD
jgi:aminopeptidase N